jgi:acyl-CoA reductase-like NAD-dependent aldehyde dehydrogenase
VKGLLQDAKQDGVIVAGGNVLQRKGYFVEPTIVRDIGDDTRLVREEQFGPILPVLRYAKVEDAIARANDTEFGLGGSVWSKNLERAVAVASQIKFRQDGMGTRIHPVSYCTQIVFEPLVERNANGDTACRCNRVDQCVAWDGVDELAARTTIC